MYLPNSQGNPDLPLLAAVDPGLEEAPPAWGLCCREFRSSVQFASLPPGGPSRSMGFWLRELVPRAPCLGLLGLSWSLVNANCSCQGLRRAPSPWPTLSDASETRREARPWAQSASPGPGWFRWPGLPPGCVNSLWPHLPALYVTRLLIPLESTWGDLPGKFLLSLGE